MKLHPAQAQIAQDKHRYRVLVCGRRFGKSMLCTEEIKGRALHDRMRRIETLPIPQDEKDKIRTMHSLDEYQCRVDYFAPTLEDSRDLVWGTLKKELSPIMVSEPNETRLEIITHNKDGGKSLIRLRSWEKVDNFRGRNTDLVIFDEFRKYKNFWLNWQEVIIPAMSDYLAEGLFLTTPQGYNHVYDFYNLEQEHDEYKSFHFTSYDNPYLSRSELEKRKEELPEDRFAQEYMADFRKTQGLVYPEFDRDKHITAAQPSQVTKIMAGIDWGYTNPASVHRIREDADRHYWIDCEFYKTQQTSDQIIEYAKTLLPELVYPDPAEPDRIAMAHKAGLNVRDVSKDIEAGIDTVRELLKQGRLHIHPDCLNLIVEFETYRYPDKKPDSNEKEKPIKENDHCMDEIRYVLHNQTPTEQETQDPYFETFNTHYRD